MITTFLLTAAVALGDFTQPHHGWRPMNHAYDGRQTTTGLAYKVKDEDPWVVGPLQPVPPAPKGATLMTFGLEAVASGEGSVVLYWSLPDRAGSFSPEREVAMRRIDATHWRAELPLTNAPQGRISFRIDLGNGTSCTSVELRRFTVDYVKPQWSGRKRLSPPMRWCGADGAALARDSFRLVHSREVMGSFRFEANGKVRAESGGDGPVVVVGADGQPDEVDLSARPPKVEAGADRLAVTATGRDRAGRTWLVRRVFVAEADGVAVETAVSCDRPADVLHLPYLTLVVDRASKGRKAQALLPGVEYLGDEPSSNEKEIRGAAANRLMPSSEKFCFPLMMLTDGADYFALRWRQTKGGDQPFAPLFDSPDRLFGTGGHLFALWAPAVGRFRRESSLDIYEPLRGFTSGGVRAKFQSGVGATVAEALAELLPPSSLPGLPTLDGPRAVELLAHGWLDSAIRQGTQVRHAIGQSFSYHRPVDAPWLMRYLACTVKDGALAARLEACAAEMLAAFPKGSPMARGVGPTVSHIRRPAGALASGDPFAYAASRRGELLNGPKALADGKRTWRAGGKDYGATLGADNCNGFTAMMAEPLATAATWTGDEAAIRAAVAAIDRVIARYRGTVPCGAQPWEMPLHCPDIVASGRLVTMCTGAWLLTGDGRYLAEARYWARSGLTMVYLHEPAVVAGGFCGVYATIGVMGATNWSQPNWIGRPVQWCGLVYAMALHELAAAETDPALAAYWRKVASGITISGVNQSYPLGDAANQGLLPDSTIMAEQVRAAPPINPGTVEENLSWLVGKPYYRCVRARTGGGAVPLLHVAGDAAALVGEAGESLRATVDAWPTPTSHVFVTRIAKPSRVLVDGVEVPFAWRESMLSFAVPARKVTVSVVR